jgi:hypothetical protein
MTTGSRYEIVGSSKSVGSFHSVHACSGVFLVMWWSMLEKVPGVTILWGWPCFIAKSLWWPIWMGCLTPHNGRYAWGIPPSTPSAARGRVLAWRMESLV